MRRYTNLPFPPYRHLPGLTPHPSRSPEGYLHGVEKPLPPPFDFEQWSDFEDYLYGVDLFNARFFWEAHEAWESLWKSSKGIPEVREFIQALIQISGAFLKRDVCSAEGMKWLGIKGLEKLRRISSHRPRAAGIDLNDWIVRLEPVLSTFPPNPLGEVPLIRLDHSDPICQNPRPVLD